MHNMNLKEDIQLRWRLYLTTLLLIVALLIGSMVVLVATGLSSTAAVDGAIGGLIAGLVGYAFFQYRQREHGGTE